MSVLACSDLMMEYEQGPWTRVLHIDDAELDPLATDWLDDSDELADVEWPNLPCASPLVVDNSSCSTGDDEHVAAHNCADVQGTTSVSESAAACALELESACTPISSCSSLASFIEAVPPDPTQAPYALDGNLRAVLKNVTVNEASVNQAIEGFGGGDRGVKVLLDYIMSWLKEQSDNFSVSRHCQPNRLGVPPPSSEHQISPMQQPAHGDLPTSNCQKFEPGSGSFYGLQQSEDPRWRLTLPEQQWQQLRLHQYTDYYNRRQPQPAITSFRSMPDVAYDAQDLRDVSTYPSSSTHGLQAAPLPSIPPYLLRAAEGSYQSGLRQQAVVSGSLHSVRNNFKAATPCLSKQAAATTMRAARKSRMAARQRGHSVSRHRSRNAASFGCTSSSTASQSCHLKKLQIQQDLSFATEGQRHNMDALLFLLHKELRPSDVSNLGRIVLPKKEAEYHLPFLQAREGMSLAMEDFDSGRIWTFRYRFWPNNKSRMYLLEVTGDFVKAHHLQEGDLLILYRNVQQGTYVVRGEKQVVLEEARNPNSVKAKSMQNQPDLPGGE